MAIYLHIPMAPFMPTLRQTYWYAQMHVKASECYIAYSEMTTLFGLFSIKKNRAFKKALQEFNKTRDHYNKLMGWGDA